jgi:hypothetical protein
MSNFNFGFNSTKQLVKKQEVLVGLEQEDTLFGKREARNTKVVALVLTVATLLNLILVPLAVNKQASQANNAVEKVK